jgi:hypothetical protein
LKKLVNERRERPLLRSNGIVKKAQNGSYPRDTKAERLRIMRCFIPAVIALLVFECTDLFAQKVDSRNYVVASYDANANEIRIADQRAKRFWQMNGGKLGERGHYLAIIVATVMPGDVIQPFWHNMINAQTGSGFLLPSAWNPGRMRCVMIYDTQSSRFVNTHGLLVIETPHRGTQARFGDYIALYIDTGSFW